MKNKSNIDLRGFTLVELLAVIVVLAIVILIAVNAVLPQMERARKSSFAIEANGAIDAANAYFMNESLTGSSGFPSTAGGFNCVTIETLINDGYSDLSKSEYQGVVKVTKASDGTNIYYFQIWLRKGTTLMVLAAGATTDDSGDLIENVSIGEDDVEGYVENTWSNAYNNTGC